MFMFVDFPKNLKSRCNIAIAVSGGSDSMALLHYAINNANRLGFNVICLNVEHGIRGESSILDSNFVKDFCKQRGIPLIFYKVDSIKHSKENHFSIEQSARQLRYQCFFDALSSNKCDLVATAHHLKDNAESVLINLFRGTALKGLKGTTEYENKIIRPMLNVSKEEIENYIKENDVPYITDETNFCTDLTRNNLRLNVLPKIKEIFPEYEKSVMRLSNIVREEDAFLDNLASQIISYSDNAIKIDVKSDPVLIKRASVLALKKLGVSKDYQSVHVDSIYGLVNKENGKSVNLPKNVLAIREYEHVCLYKNNDQTLTPLPFFTGEFYYNEMTFSIEETTNSDLILKDGLYFDGDKISKTAKIRTMLPGDKFTKFGGGTKNLSDFFTDKKIPLRKRNKIPLIADGEKVLAIFGIAISNDIKVDESTKRILKLAQK